MMNLQPLRAWHIAALLGSKANARFFAHAEHLSHCVDRINAGSVAILVEKGVTRNFDRVAESDCSMRVMFFVHPALKEVVAIANAAPATVTRGREVFAQTGQRGDELEGRSRRKGADGTVMNGGRFILSQRFPIFRFDAGNKGVRVERWH